MNIFERIAIGTANWGKEYNGVKVPDKDIQKILGYAQCSGIDTLDTATAYGWDWTQANSYFNKIIKIQSADEIEKVVGYEPYCIMAHNNDVRDACCNSGSTWGMSCYDVVDVNGPPPDILQVPYSLYDRRFEKVICEAKNPYVGYHPEDRDEPTEIHVRSIFLRGKIIEDGIPAEEAIKFVLANPFIDKVIIGADSFDQLRWNLDFVVKWNNLEKHDEELLDPRKWDKQ